MLSFKLENGLMFTTVHERRMGHDDDMIKHTTYRKRHTKHSVQIHTHTHTHVISLSLYLSMSARLQQPNKRMTILM